MDKKFQKIEASLDSITKLISNLPTRTEMNTAVSDAVKDLPTRSEMNTAISEAVKDLPTRSEMNTAIENRIDEFAGIVAKGFEGVDRRFDEMDKKFTERIDRLEKKVDLNHIGLSNQLDYVLLHYTRREEHNEHGVRLKRLEKVC